MLSSNWNDTFIPLAAPLANPAAVQDSVILCGISIGLPAAARPPPKKTSGIGSGHGQPEFFPYQAASGWRGTFHASPKPDRDCSRVDTNPKPAKARYFLHAKVLALIQTGK
jgi:hypothetical protein